MCRAGWLEHVVGERDATIDALRKENDELKAANEAAAEAIAKAEQKTEVEMHMLIGVTLLNERKRNYKFCCKIIQHQLRGKR